MIYILMRERVNSPFALITNSFAMRHAVLQLITQAAGRKFIYMIGHNYYVIDINVAKVADGAKVGVGLESISNKSGRGPDASFSMRILSTRVYPLLKSQDARTRVLSKIYSTARRFSLAPSLSRRFPIRSHVVPISCKRVGDVTQEFSLFLSLADTHLTPSTRVNTSCVSATDRGSDKNTCTHLSPTC